MRSLFGWLHRLSMILTVIGGYFTRAHNAAEEDEMLKSDDLDDMEIEDGITKVTLRCFAYGGVLPTMESLRFTRNMGGLEALLTDTLVRVN